MSNAEEDRIRRAIPPYDMDCAKCGFLAKCVLEAQSSRSEAIVTMATQASITHRMLMHKPNNGQLPW